MIFSYYQCNFIKIIFLTLPIVTVVHSILYQPQLGFPSQTILFTFEFLPPRNEVSVGYVFTRVCLSTGGVPRQVHTPGQVHPWQVHLPAGTLPSGRYTPWAGAPQTDTPPCAVHAGIQSTSGRHATRWNAFLFRM